MRLSIVFIVLTGLSGYACATSTIDTYGNTTYLDDDDGNTTTYDNFGGTVYGSDGSMMDMVTQQHVTNTEIRLTVIDLRAGYHQVSCFRY